MEQTKMKQKQSKTIYTKTNKNQKPKVTQHSRQNAKSDYKTPTDIERTYKIQEEPNK